MKGELDFEAEEDGLSFGLGDEEDEDEVADSWQDANIAISITSINIIVLTVLTPMDFILKVVVQQWLRQEKSGIF
jgi:hypothetical protein